MRLHEISEYSRMDLDGGAQGDSPAARLELLKPMLMADYSEILQIYKHAGGLIYRGVKDIRPEFTASIRPNRTPGYLSQIRTGLANEAIRRCAGRANRTNSIFCSANSLTAADWGSVYIVLPKNGWIQHFFLTCRTTMFLTH